GGGWAHSGASRWDPADHTAEEHIAHLLAAARERARGEAENVRAKTREALTSMLASLVATYGTLTAENADDWATGSETDPGVYFDTYSDSAVAWDYDPTATDGETI